MYLVITKITAIFNYPRILIFSVESYKSCDLLQSFTRMIAKFIVSFNLNPVKTVLHQDLRIDCITVNMRLLKVYLWI